MLAVISLLNQGGDPNYANSTGLTLLHMVKYFYLFVSTLTYSIHIFLYQCDFLTSLRFTDSKDKLSSFNLLNIVQKYVSDKITNVLQHLPFNFFDRSVVLKTISPGLSFSYHTAHR